MVQLGWMLGISPPPGQLGSDDALEWSALVNQFLLRVGFFPLLGSTKGFFSELFCENLVKFLEVKLTKV